jgi:metal-sulfur cluster biosynthetic enzyme
MKIPAGRAHQHEVEATLNGILDPCSVASTVPIGLTDMGLIDEITVANGRVSVAIMTTAPHCMYAGHFITQIEERVRELPWVTDVEVTISHAGVWDESRMATAARDRLKARFGRTRPAA